MEIGSLSSANLSQLTELAGVPPEALQELESVAPAGSGEGAEAFMDGYELELSDMAFDELCEDCG